MGSIEKRDRQGPNGKPITKYRARVRVDGVVKQETFPRERDAKAWINKQEHAKATGTAVASNLGRMKYGALLDEWLAMRAKRSREQGKPAPSTLARDRQFAESYIRPTFGSKRLKDIRRHHVQDWVDELSASGGRDREPLKAGTVVKAYGILALTMKEAVKREYLGATPCTEVEMPDGEGQEMRFLSEVEMYRLADAIEPCYRALVLVLGFAGLRIGEALALTPEDVHLGKRPELVVSKSVTTVQTEVGEGDKRGKSEVVLRDATKTKAGTRRVAIPRDLAEELEHHLKHYATAGLVFPTEADSRRRDEVGEAVHLRHGNFRRRYFQPAVERAGLAPLRVHDLRHSAIASWIRHDPANQLAISRRAGHTKSSFTMDRYGHVFRDAEHEAMERYNDRLREVREAENVVPIRAREA